MPFYNFIRATVIWCVLNDTDYDAVPGNQQDTLKENQALYIGKIWRNLYFKVREDQFLFSNNFLTGSLTINAEQFKNISLRYDIYNDEIMTLSNLNAIIQLNKEMVDSFTLDFENTTYRFARIQEDTIKAYKGFFNVLYKGKTTLLIKYRKEIELLAVERRYDRFYPTHKIYLINNGIIYPITGKGDLLELLVDY